MLLFDFLFVVSDYIYITCQVCTTFLMGPVENGNGGLARHGGRLVAVMGVLDEVPGEN